MHAEASLQQFGTGSYAQTPPTPVQLSLVQTSESSQSDIALQHPGAAVRTFMQLAAAAPSAHVSTVHAFVSTQTFDDACVQAPAKHVSLPLQKSPSLQGVVSAAKAFVGQAALVPSHVS